MNTAAEVARLAADLSGDPEVEVRVLREIAKDQERTISSMRKAIRRIMMESYYGNEAGCSHCSVVNEIACHAEEIEWQK